MQKLIHIEGIAQPVVLTRRKGAKHLKLSVKNRGTVRVTVPFGVPEALAVRFVREKSEWIAQHHTPHALLHDGDRIGKSHTLAILESPQAMTIRTRIKFNTATVTIPEGLPHTDIKVQNSAKKVAEKALSLEAETLLPQRLETLAKKHAVRYGSVSTRKLKSRWGSCDSQKNITLSIYLLQMPWELIDYVIIHELAHTIHHHHQKPFWEEVARMLPEWKGLRKTLKSKPTEVQATNF